MAEATAGEQAYAAALAITPGEVFKAVADAHRDLVVALNDPSRQIDALKKSIVTLSTKAKALADVLKASEETKNVDLILNRGDRIMAATPSNILVLTSQVMGDAQARIRALAMAAPDLETVDALIAKREVIDAQQRRIMRANMAIIDKDPAVQNNIDQLTRLTAELAAGVQEMRDATSAIRAATRFISLVDAILPLFKIA